MASETRKLRRTQTKQEQPTGKEKRAQLTAPLVSNQQALPDPFGPAQLRSTLLRVGLILLAVWFVLGLIAGISTSKTVSYVSLGVAAVLTATVVGVLVWTIRRAKKAREVAGILQGATTQEERQRALEKLSQDASGDPAKLFAKAQLEMQEDPRKALATLETLDLNKQSGGIADEARGQRAMIHLTLGQIGLARQLVDNIDLKRQQDPRSRAMIAAIAAEAWARSGELDKAQKTLEAFDLGEAELAAVRPQLLRALAYVQVHAGKLKELKRTLKQMMDIDARLLGAFFQGKGHPLLQKEAKRLIEQSGIVPRRMQVQRTR